MKGIRLVLWNRTSCSFFISKGHLVPPIPVPVWFGNKKMHEHFVMLKRTRIGNFFF